jgi:hypothetical protein
MLISALHFSSDGIALDRAALICHLNDKVSLHLERGLCYRAAVRRVAAEERMPVLSVRRLTCDHPVAPLP